ncbi:MAG: SGNH/GDSL hydrolase family protein [Alphaproteobacteria bacterium]|nr:SGNH/GDSL hydrolase family protein [Alphaproteobacteria bacterium]
MSGALNSVLSFLGVTVSGFEGGNTPVNPNAPFGNIYAFGDSLSDAGNDFILSLNHLPVSPPYVDGHFTNGPTWVQDLAASMSLPTVSASLSGGTDFAYGGAETGSEPLHSANLLDLPTQLAEFRAEYPHPNPNALYTVWAGSNDVIDAINEWFVNPTTAFADLQQAVNNIADFSFSLAEAGAKNMLLLTVPDIGKTPEEREQGKSHAHVGHVMAKLFDQDLTQTMQVVAAQAHLNLGILDTFSLIDQAVKHPQQFGITNTKDPVWTGNFTDPNSGTLVSTNPAVQNQHLFWDKLHPTAQGHSVVAAAAHSVLFG